MPTHCAADLAVCRSGASTSFELLAAGLPSILIPSPFVTADHQTANARHVERAGAAVVVPDAELDGRRLAFEVDRLLGDPARLAHMSQAALAAARPQAADDIAALARGPPWLSSGRRALTTAIDRRPPGVHVANGGGRHERVAVLLAESGTGQRHDPRRPPVPGHVGDHGSR